MIIISRLPVGLLVVCLCVVTAIGDDNTNKQNGSDQAVAERIIEVTGVQGGLIVHLGCGDVRLTAALRTNDRYLVHGLATDAETLRLARESILSRDLYGKVSIDRFDGEHLPYIDNLVNLLVVSGRANVDADEIKRVLCPGGVAVSFDPETRNLKPETLLRKPWPEEIDEWTHYLHDATNNAVAQDTIVGPPQHFQWIGSPDYLRHHDHLSGLSAMVSTAGRLFYIMDLGPRWSVQMPPQWTLIARDAFNGTVLWQRPIDRWHAHLWPLKKGPARLMRRLVARGLRFLRLDARTGRKISETLLDDKYPGTQDNLQRSIRWPNLPVALPDVLSCDGRHIYMRSQPFDFDGNRTEVITTRDATQQRGETAHLFSPTGFLDDSWWHRTYWLYGRSFVGGAGGWYLAGYQAPAGRILVFDDEKIYGFGRVPMRQAGTMTRKPHRTSKKNAIRNALGQLGWHAKGRDVVAFLANFGIEVNAGLVSKVKMESLKRPGEVTRHEQEVKTTDKRRKQRTQRKIQQQKEYRR